MNSNMNSRLRHPLTRLHRNLLIILAALAVFTLATNPVNAAAVNICSRTPEVREAILASVTPTPTCSTITDTQLAGITGEIAINAYSNAELLKSDFAGLTGVTHVALRSSQALRKIPADAFDELNKAQIIGITMVFNGIEEVEAGVFDGFTAITTLNLNTNAIQGLDAELFDSLSTLQRLALHANDLKTVDADLFDGLSSLQRLSLQTNALRTLDADLFDGLSSLQNLDLQTNDLLTLDAGVFDGLSSLQRLDLNHNALTTLDADLFDGLSSLEQLYLNDNGLTTLDAGVFDGLSSLQRLGLHNNGLTTLDAGVFDGLSSLQRLYFDNNDLKTLDADLFNGLSSLIYLRLPDNGLTTLDADLFDGLSALQRLDLNNNALTTLDADLFDGLSSLRILYLNDNGLMTVDADLFDGLSSLQQLYLQNNKLTTVDADLFDGLSSLQQLYLQNNKLTTVDADLFDGLPLQQLDLSNNALTTLDADLFDGLSSLQQLYLQNNKLTTVDADLFDGLSSLQQLYLHDNGLMTMDADLFDGLSSLELLSLRSNSLTALPTGVFDGLTGLKRLDISCNTLVTLDLTLFTPLASALIYLNVGANSFTTAPVDSTVRGTLTALEVLRLSDVSPCASAADVGLSDLTATPGVLTPTFVKPGVADYILTVPPDTEMVTVVPTLSSSLATWAPTVALFDSDPNTPGIQYDMTTGQSPALGFTVTAEDRSNNTSYYINIIKEKRSAAVTRLRGLQLSGLTLSPTFESSEGTYTATAGVPETTVTATPLDPEATTVIKLNGTADADGTVDLQLGENAITVEVIAEDGTTMQTYTVTVTLEATISFGSGKYYVTEGAEVEVTVELSNAPSRHASITIPFEYPADSDPNSTLAKKDSDYSAFPGPVVIGANETSASFTITTTQDTEEEGDENFHILLLRPRGINHGDHFSTTVTIIDDDTPGMTITPRTLDVDEGGTATYTVKLNTAPSGNVTVAITSDDTGAATVFPEMLTFTTTDWNTAKTVTVTGVEDSNLTNESVTLSNDPSGANYDMVSTVEVTVDVTDNDSPGVNVSQTALTVREANTTGASYTVALHTQPTANVTVTVAGHAGTDVTPSPTTLTFTSQNWDTAQTVTVTAGDDTDTVKDVVTLTHTATSTDTGYQGITISSVTVTVTDNDRPSPPPGGGGGGGGSGGGSSGGGGGGGGGGGAPQNRSPAFSDGSMTDRSVAENTPAGADIGEPVVARDREDDTLTYSLRGADAESFDIDPSSGQLLTKAPLDYEAKDSYSVIVSVSDGKSSSGRDSDSRDGSITVTINVENVDEPGSVALSSHQPQVAVALTATLTDPDGGLSGITWLWERSADQAAWTEINGARTESYTPAIGDLSSYLRVTASYTDGHGRGKSAGTATGDPVLINTVPRFPGVGIEIEVEEGYGDAESGGAGEPVAAADPDGDTLTYSLSGGDAGSFEIDASTGQLWSKAPLDYETQAVYTVVVSVRDGRDFNGDPDTAVDASVTVTIVVVNVGEPGTLTLLSSQPRVGVPFAARLTDPDGVVGEVVWKWERSRDGNPWSNSWRAIGGAESSAYAPVEADLGYYLRVTASYADGHGPDKSRQAISDAPVEENVGPVFPDDPDGVFERSVAENTGEGEVVGAPVAATSPSGSALTYAIGGSDAALFAIDAGTGQIRVGAGTALDYEGEKNVYEVTVTATDSSGVSATVAVTIRLTDVDLGPYDVNKNEAIERDEALAAVVDYFADRITKEEALEVVQLYFAS